MRRAHDALSIPAISQDSETGEMHRRHHVTETGFYRGKQMIIPKEVYTADEE
jgi:large subunit ribosomal protein L32